MMTFRMLNPTSLTLAAATALAGCGPSVTIEDDLQPDTGRRAEDDHGDVLHAPYATGSRFAVTVRGLDPDECERLRFEMDDPVVVGVAADEEDPCRARLGADHPGRTVLRIREGEDEVRAVDLEVATATSATIHPRGMLRAGLEEAYQPWQSAKVLAFATATFTVRWWDESGRELAARDLLRPTVADGLAVGPPPGRVGNADWLQVTPLTPGAHSSEVGTDRGALAAIVIETVPPADVTSLDILAGEVPGDDDRSVLLALARTAAGDVVLGLQPTWTVDGEPVVDDEGTVVQGDLFLYEEGGSYDETVTAEAPGLSATTEIALRGEPSVESSNGCSAVPGLPAPAGALLLLASSLLALRRLSRTT